MPHRNRRVSRVLFEEIMKSGKSVHVSHLSLRVYRLLNSTETRVAISIPKKTEKRATARNRVKRRIAAVLRGTDIQLPQAQALIFFGKSGISELSTQELGLEIKNILSKAFRL